MLPEKIRSRTIIKTAFSNDKRDPFQLKLFQSYLTLYPLEPSLFLKVYDRLTTFIIEILNACYSRNF